MERETFGAHTIEMDDTVIVHCTGRLVRSNAAYHLRNVVQSTERCQRLILDLSEVETIEAGGLGMLAVLQRWTQENGIQLKLLHPSPRVYQRLQELELSVNCRLGVECESNLLRLVGFPDREHWVASTLAA